MNKWKRFQRKIKFKGKTYKSVYEACNKLKFSYGLALSRLAKGESVENVFYKAISNAWNDFFNTEEGQDFGQRIN